MKKLYSFVLVAVFSALVGMQVFAQKNAVISSWASSAMVSADNSVYVWGSNAKGSGSSAIVGTLGIGSSEEYVTQPTKVTFPEGVTIKQVDTRGASFVALGCDSSVWCWGDNTYGQCGSGTRGGIVTSPSRVVAGCLAETEYDKDGYLCNVDFICEGNANSFAVLGDGQYKGYMVAWGANIGDGIYGGCLGTGNNAGNAAPAWCVDLTGEKIKNIVAVSAGDDVTMVLDSDGHVWTCGGYDDSHSGLGRLANGGFAQSGTSCGTSNKFGMVYVAQEKPLANIREIAAASKAYFTLDVYGYVWSWGSVWNYATGNGAMTDGNSPKKVLKGTTDDADNDGAYLLAKAISAGQSTGLAVSITGKPVAWGGVPGNGSSYETEVPGYVRYSATNVHSDVVGVYRGKTEGWYMRSDGTLYGWGENEDDQLGLMSAGVQRYATQINTIPSIRDFRPMAFITTRSKTVCASAFGGETLDCGFMVGENMADAYTITWYKYGEQVSTGNGLNTSYRTRSGADGIGTYKVVVKYVGTNSGCETYESAEDMITISAFDKNFDVDDFNYCNNTAIVTVATVNSNAIYSWWKMENGTGLLGKSTGEEPVSLDVSSVPYDDDSETTKTIYVQETALTTGHFISLNPNTWSSGSDIKGKSSFSSTGIEVHKPILLNGATFRAKLETQSYNYFNVTTDITASATFTISIYGAKNSNNGYIADESKIMGTISKTVTWTWNGYTGINAAHNSYENIEITGTELSLSEGMYFLRLSCSNVSGAISYIDAMEGNMGLGSPVDDIDGSYISFVGIDAWGLPCNDRTGDFFDISFSPKAGYCDVVPVTLTKSCETYTITLRGMDEVSSVDGLEIPSTLTYTYGFGSELPQESTEGFTFHGWYANPDFSGPEITSISNLAKGDTVLYGNWTANEYDVTLNTNGGTIGSGNVTSYTHGVVVTLPTEVTKTNYTFGGWFTNSSCSGTAVTEISIHDIGNKTFYAKWMANEYDVTLNTNGGTISSGNVTSYTYGVGVTLPTKITKTGYTFEGWYANSDFSGSKITSISKTAVGDTAFYAKWTVGSYEVTLNVNGGTIIGEDNLDILIDDCSEYSGYNKLGGEWSVYNDSLSRVENHCTSGKKSKMSSIVCSEETYMAIYEIGTDILHESGQWSFGSYAGIETALGNIDFSSVDGISFLYKGPRCMFYVIMDGIEPSDYHQYEVPDCSDWTQIRVLWGDLTQPIWASTVTFSPTRIQSLRWEIYAWHTIPDDVDLSNTTGSIWIDDIRTFGESTINYTYGVGMLLPVPQKEGYAFGGWYENSSFNGDPVTEITTTDYGDKIFSAKWMANEYDVTLNTNGGTISSGNITSYTYGAGAVLPTPTKTGHSFDGWYANSDFSGSKITAISATAMGDTAFYAKWTVNSYEVTLNTRGGTINSGNVTEYTYGVGATLPTDVTKEGDTFGGWFTNSSCTGIAVTEISTTDYGNKTFYAKWNANVYDVTLNTNGGTISSGNITSYTYGVGATLPTPTKTGHTFGGWYAESDFSGTAITSVSATAMGDTAFYAKWTANKYGITLNTNYGTINSGNVTEYTYGVGATLPTDVTMDGYTFKGWYENSNLLGTKVTAISTTDIGAKEYWAKWAAATYTITFVTNGGTINSGKVTLYTYGSGAILPADVTKSGSEFLGWYEDEACETEQVLMISDEDFGNKTYYAKWSTSSSTPTFTLTVSSDNNGTATGSGTYEQNTEVTISATPNTGYKFQKWSDGNTENPRTVTVTKDSSLVAVFSALIEIQVSVQRDAVISSWECSAMVDADGFVYVWGNNVVVDGNYTYRGSLGVGSSEDYVSQPTKVQFPEDIPIKQVDTRGKSFIAIGCDGSVWCWGDNTYGQCGTGTRGGIVSIPSKVRAGCLAGTYYDGDGYLRYVDFVCEGNANSFAVLGEGPYEGNMVAWGGNIADEYYTGCLGIGTNNGNTAPEWGVDLSGNKIRNVVAVSASDDVTMVLDSDGHVWTCGGKNNNCILGRNASGGFSGTSSCGTSNRFGMVYVAQGELLENIQEISTSSTVCFALDTDGYIWSWGHGWNYANGLGVEGDFNYPNKVIKGTTNEADNDGTYLLAKSISAGQSTGMAVSITGKPVSWGGVPGNGTSLRSEVPGYVFYSEGMVHSDVIGVYRGYTEGWYLRSDGLLYGWGENQYGQLGDGGREAHVYAEEIENAPSIKAFSPQAEITPKSMTVSHTTFEGITINCDFEILLGSIDSYRITWYKDGVLISTGNGLNTSYTTMSGVSGIGEYMITVEYIGDACYGEFAKDYHITILPEVTDFIVTLNTNGGTISSGNITTYTYGVGATLPTPTKTGHTFDGWYAESDFSGTAITSISATAIGDTAFYAKWVDTYNVTLNTNGGTISSGNITTYTYGVGATLPTDVTKTGYTFGGWFTNSSCTGTAVTEISTNEYGNKTFYAKWNANVYDVTLNTDGGTISSGNITSYTYGVGATLPTPTKTGHTFKGWYAKSDFSGQKITSISATAMGDTAFYAKWTANTYGVTLNTNYGTINSGNVTEYTYGLGATLPIDVTMDGYTFKGWYENSNLLGTKVTAISTTDIGAKEYWAKWAVATYTITFVTNGGTINSGKVTLYTYGSGAILPADVTMSGSEFLGWYEDEACETEPVLMVSDEDFGNKTFYAKWSTQAAHLHSYEMGAWSWSSDNKSATLTFVCSQNSEHTEIVPATVSIDTVEATCKQEGSITYTAMVTFEETQYTDSKEVTLEKLNHTADTILPIAPTCTTEGWTGGNVCSVCGDTLVKPEMIPATGHAADTIYAIAPTCTTEGWTGGNVCSVCGDTIVKPEMVPATGHTADTIYAIAPTCTKEGWTGGTVCSVCGDTLVRPEMVPATGHTADTIYAIAPTCTKEGWTGGNICSVCGDTLVKPEMVPATGHTADTIYAIAPTCTKEGWTGGNICSVCGDTLVRPEMVPATGHTADTIYAIAPTCTTEGWTGGTVCSVCGDTLVRPEIVPATGHTADTIMPIAPTCTKEGWTGGNICSVCGDTLVRPEIVAATGHTADTIYAIAPTCTKEGWTGGSVCSVCGDTLVKPEMVPAIGHTADTIYAIAPTCTTEGWTGGTVCSVCGDTIVKPEMVPATGHKADTIMPIAPTCTTEGWTGGNVCFVCGDTLVKPEMVPATGHTADTIMPIAPTCTKEGWTGGNVCSVCGDTLVRPEMVPATGHTADTIYAIAPTCTTEGWTGGNVCSVCGDTLVKPEMVSATGHTADTIYAIAPTCTTEGWTGGNICSVCGDTLVRPEMVPANDHHTLRYIAAVAPTKFAEGNTEYWQCTECGKLFDSESAEHEITMADVVLEKLTDGTEYDRCDVEVSAVVQNCSCFGVADGAIELEIDNVDDYYVSWSNGRSGSSAQELTAGMYYVSIIGNDDCQLDTSFVVTEPDEILVTETITHPSCNSSDGKIEVSTNATNPRYVWSDITFRNTLENASAGEYELTVTSENGCSVTKKYTLSNPGAPVIEIDTVLPARSRVHDGGIAINVTGGNGAFTYSWDNGSSTKNLGNLQAGDYTVQVTDENNCVAVQTITVPPVGFTNPEISLVTVDRLTQHNLVVWEREETDEIHHYNVYRESSHAFQYEKIGEVPYNDISVFEDEQADVKHQSTRYRITAVDYDGNESVMSKEHKTMLLAQNAGLNKKTVNLIWDSYEGIDYTMFRIYRNTLFRGWELIDSVSSRSFIWIDDNVPLDIIGYTVAIELPREINPKIKWQKAESGPFNIAISNIAEVENETAVDGVVNDNVKVYPLAKQIIIENAEKQLVKVCDNTGRELYRKNASQVCGQQLRVDIRTSGVYFVMVGTQAFTVIVE